MDVTVLSRIQFAFTITFHYIFPPLSIGLSIALIIMEAMYLKTKDVLWEKITKFWLKVFSMTFALGVATGIPMIFSFGTNWARYSRFVSDVSGSILGIEGMFAFLIEAGFLGVLLFGWHKVSKKVHFLSTILVSFGAHFSAVWIVTLNSWMQTPTGHKIVTLEDGTTVAQVADWWQVFLNPSNINHLVHVIIGAWMAGAFLIISIASYYILKSRFLEFARRSMKVGLLMGMITVILQLIAADSLARNVAKHNPEKFAAFEAVYKTEKATPAYLFGWVDQQNQKVYGLAIPGLLSFMTHHNIDTPVPGLEQFPKAEQPPLVNAVFQFYHLMVIMWLLMAIVAFVGGYHWWRKNWHIRPFFLKFMMFSVIFPQLGNIAGWYSSEIGRQPWTVYKLLRTSEAVSPIISKGQVWGSLIMFVIMYSLFFVLFLVLLNRKIKVGPQLEPVEDYPYRRIPNTQKPEEKN